MKTYRHIIIVVTLTSSALLSGCWQQDDNAVPKYGKETGAPVNCRAYVQLSIDEYRNGRFSADDAMAGLERNCGLFGHAWADNRKD